MYTSISISLSFLCRNLISISEQLFFSSPSYTIQEIIPSPPWQWAESAASSLRASLSTSQTLSLSTVRRRLCGAMLMKLSLWDTAQRSFSSPLSNTYVAVVTSVGAPIFFTFHARPFNLISSHSIMTWREDSSVRREGSLLCKEIITRSSSLRMISLPALPCMCLHLILL